MHRPRILKKGNIFYGLITFFTKTSILPGLRNQSSSTLTHSSTTLTEVFPCFFLSCKANARVTLAKTGHGPHSSKLVVICVVLSLFVLFCCYCFVLLLFVLFCLYLYCSMYCLCVNVYCTTATGCLPNCS